MIGCSVRLSHVSLMNSRTDVLFLEALQLAAGAERDAFCEAWSERSWHEIQNKPDQSTP